MSDIIITPELSNLGSPCYRTEQERYNDYMLRTTWKQRLGDLAGILVQETTPSVDDQDKLWVKLSSDGGAIYPAPLIWSTDYAQWISPHPIVAGSGAISLWVGPLSGAGGLDTYDHGDALPAAVTPTTGQFWEVLETSWADRILGVVGKTGGGAAPTNLLAVNTDYNVTKDGTDNTRVQVRTVYLIRRTARIYYRG